MPRISAEREEATRRRILKAARQVFVQKGFHRASIDDVVAACGLSVGAIYTYFPNKDELIRASILDANREESDALLADTRAAGSVGDRLDRGIRGWWRYTIEAEGAPAFLAEAWGEATRRPLIRDLMARRYERGITMTSIMFRECIERGDLPTRIDVDALARTIGALTDGMVLEYVVSGGTLRFEDAQNRIRLVLEAAIQEAAAPARGA
jgi:TetR/AcrR family transcriptional regulator, transcriptional repressor of aconitase